MTEHWVIGGVAAEIATRLRASASFVRALLLVAAFLQPTGVLVAYGAAAVLLPRGGARLPRWSGLVAGGRYATLLLIPAFLTGGGLTLEELFSSGPAMWVPLGGVAAAAIIAILAWRPAVDAIDEARCRTLVLGALPVVALAGAVVAGMALAPGVRWDRVLAALLIFLAAVLVATAGRHRIAAAALLPAAALGVAILILAGSGARLEGGIGDLGLVPRQDGDVVAKRAVGNVLVDLSALPSSTTEVTVRASTGVGEVHVILPRRANASADVRVGRGQISPGRFEGGFHLTRHLSGGSTAPRRLPVWVRIVAEAGIGEVRISRVNGSNGRGEL